MITHTAPTFKGIILYKRLDDPSDIYTNRHNNLVAADYQQMENNIKSLFVKNNINLALTGNDLRQFMKESYKIDLTDAFYEINDVKSLLYQVIFGSLKTKVAIVKMLFLDIKHHRNFKTSQPKMMEMAFDYASKRASLGTDIDGKPIEYRTL